MSRTLLIPAIALAAAVSACAPTLGPPPPGAARSGAAPDFRADDFAWSTSPGRNGITGRMAPRPGATRYSCSGASVVLTPDTPWTRRRMEVLYQSPERAALPVEEVRGRTAQAPAGDASAFIRRTTCDSADRFAFSGLPDGGWYVITTAKPVAGAGPTLALMRRVTTRGGRVANAEL